jgi:hypothetical protein
MLTYRSVRIFDTPIAGPEKISKKYANW